MLTRAENNSPAVPPVHTRARNNPKRHGIRFGAAVGGIMILF
ncbi:hypothetical protein ACGFI4_30080 [Micromonospora carbonacea]|uniref:Uncharacterized protein n=1 Tax=Micromonospora carbonacea TaxID=47853 RepID=A0A1C4ZRF5_9ACTN|nr:MULTISPECIES: hypothetical protein [Micromonospora]MBB5826923.1 hypothetical protein [Micromonospora carbonacea]WFE55610.1 hypothetical protein O7633_01480 [Micromonospora sp. WMMD712]SCF35555.1 hypothetical protein GA0070563_109169 [Micromonospora carbonacea]